MNDESSQESLMLEAKLNLMAAAPLAQTLTQLQNTPVQIDGSNVSHIDLPCLQILIAAARHWHGSNTPFSITNMSEDFLSGLAVLGLSPEIFQTSETF